MVKRVIEAEVTKPVKKPSKAGTAVIPIKKAKTEVGEVTDWRAEMAKAAAKTVKMEESVATGNRISTKGGKLTYHDTQLKDNTLNCIVLAALIENCYYDGPYDPNNPQSPVCFAFSEDGEDMAPHEKAHQKQSETCEGCPQNEWGSDDRGRGKACKNLRRLAVIAFDDGDLSTIQEGDIATVSVSVTSVKLWSGYSKQIAMDGRAIWAYQTEMSLEREEGKEFSNLHFQTATGKPLPEKFYPAILKRVREAEKLLETPYVYTEPPPPRARGGRAVPAKSAKKAGKGKF